MRMKLSVLKRLGLSALLAAGLASLACAQGAAQFDGQYTGELRLARTFSGDCTEPPVGALYPLTIAGGEVRFAYLPRFATTLRGTIRQDGLFRATARARKGVVQMGGRIHGVDVTASIVSSGCAYTFQTLHEIWRRCCYGLMASTYEVANGSVRRAIFSA